MHAICGGVIFSLAASRDKVYGFGAAYAFAPELGDDNGALLSPQPLEVKVRGP